MIPLSTELLAAIQHAAELLRTARQAVVLTGAGYSTPSGIPDFRTAGSGLWTKYLPMEVASLTTFRHNPELFFAWLRPLASHMISAQPNAAHLALARLEQAGYIQTVITQNIDGLHHRAGGRHILEVHGTFNTLTCVSCFQQIPSQGFLEAFVERGQMPKCPDCGSVLKPDIILYEEQLPVQTWLEAEATSKACDLMLVAGTSLEVLPSARLPLFAVEKGARLIIVNHSPTYMDVRADLIISEDVALVIPALCTEVLHD